MVIGALMMVFAHNRAFDVNNDGMVDWNEFYHVLDTWDRSGSTVRAGGAGRGVAGSGRPRQRLWETDDAVRVALDNLVAELYDRRGDVQAMLERLDRNGTGTLSRQEMQRGLMGLGIRLKPSELSQVMRYDRGACPIGAA